MGDEKAAEALKASRDKIIAALDDAAEHYSDKKEEFEDEFSDGEMTDELNDFTREKAKKMIDTIPDKEVNEKVHKMLKSGDINSAETAIHDFFVKFVKENKDEKAAEALKASK